MKIFKEWFEQHTNGRCRHFPRRLKEEYEDGDILHFWYLFNQDSPAVEKFIVGLSVLMDECFPDERKYQQTLESDTSPITYRYICVRHEDD